MPKIINAMKHMNYAPNEGGMCFGLAAMAAQAVIRQEGGVYRDRINAIQNTNDLPETVKKMNEKSQLNAFFDGVCLYMKRGAKEQDFLKALGVSKIQNIPEVSAFFSDSKETPKGEDKRQFANPHQMPPQFLSRFNKEEIMRFLEETKKNNPNMPFSILIHYPGHTVQIGYDTHQWLSVDHDKTQYKMSLSEAIDGVLIERCMHKGKHWLARVDILSSDKNLKLDTSEIQVEKKLSDISDEELKSALSLSLTCGNINEMVFLLDEALKRNNEKANGFDFFTQEDSNTTPPLYYVFQDNDEAKLRLLMSKLIKFKQPQDRLYDFLEAKDKYGTPGFFTVLQYGSEGMLKIFIEGLKGLGVSLDQIFKLLVAKDENGPPGLFMAYQYGHEGVFKVITESLKGLGLSPEQIFKMLAAKRSDGTAGLFMAFYNGHEGVLHAMIEGLKSLPLSSEQVMELLATKDKSGVPGLFFALNNGHIKTVQMFIAGVESLNLSFEDKIALLEAKLPGDITSIAFLMKKGCSVETQKVIDEVKKAISKLKKEQSAQSAQTPSTLSARIKFFNSK